MKAIRNVLKSCVYANTVRNPISRRVAETFHDFLCTLYLYCQLREPFIFSGSAKLYIPLFEKSEIWNY